MIGVLADGKDWCAVREFFELFKTPWEPCRSGRRYSVVVASSPKGALPDADLRVVYGLDPGNRICPNGHAERTQAVLVCYREQRFPLYCGCSRLPEEGKRVVIRDGTGRAVGLETVGKASKTVRMGFDLFAELDFLLSVGQPAEHASVPTLDIHVSILRDLIVGAGVPLVEIPPTPPGCDLIVCLTHDVDFVGIRQHRLDRTVLGFLYRATMGSLVRCLKGQLSLVRLLRNLVAAVSLPLIHLGLVPDFFNQFDRYLRLEGKHRSTFFLVPFKNLDGHDAPGSESKGRATRYDVGDIAPEVAAVLAKGGEVALHGLDAWHDGVQAAAERARIRGVTATDPVGVRMHWLYFSQMTPGILEQAGFCYDSTCGYNDAIGFRAGTAQVFRPLGAESLLELPLHVQDTALFSSGRMGLTQRQGIRAIDEVVQRIRRNQGVLTVNWHLRSLGPERQWDAPYRHLLEVGGGVGVWVATAREVVEFFAMRRSADFTLSHSRETAVTVRGRETKGLPRLAVATYCVRNDQVVRREEVALRGEIMTDLTVPRS